MNITHHVTRIVTWLHNKKLITGESLILATSINLINFKNKLNCLAAWFLFESALFLWLFFYQLVIIHKRIYSIYNSCRIKNGYAQSSVIKSLCATLCIGIAVPRTVWRVCGKEPTEVFLSFCDQVCNSERVIKLVWKSEVVYIGAGWNEALAFEMNSFKQAPTKGFSVRYLPQEKVTFPANGTGL